MSRNHAAVTLSLTYRRALVATYSAFVFKLGVHGVGETGPPVVQNSVRSLMQCSLFGARISSAKL